MLCNAKPIKEWLHEKEKGPEWRRNHPGPRICAPARAIGSTTLTHVSISNTNQFAQQNPRYTCRAASHFRSLSQQKGYVCKCRNPRCSLDCQKNWSRKLGTCLSRHLSDQQAKGYQVLTGNLMMAAGSTASMHRDARAKFLKSIKRWADRHGYVVQVHGTIHVTAPDACHWDVGVWTNAPLTPLHDFWAKAWVRAGGRRLSLVVPGDIEASAHYQAKPVARVRDQAHYLPSSSGLECTWATAGFWGDTSADEVWAKVIREWLALTKPEPAPNKQDRTYDHSGQVSESLRPR
ncbi:hypothetical protein VT85_14715 [Planctomyces sp. SH-PL62]|nr:hypothetical protein VT85_14715 [Planctomyces sp. SH-PL62]